MQRIIRFFSILMKWFFWRRVPKIGFKVKNKYNAHNN